MKPATLAGIFLLLCSSLGAADLAELLEAAVRNDIRLKVLNATLDNTLRAIERARLAPGRNLELSTGDIRAAYSFEPGENALTHEKDPNWLISFNPSAALLLGRKTETQITAEIPVGVGVDARGVELAVLPAVAIRQPLNSLVNGKQFSAVEELQNRYAAEKARIDIVKRVKSIEQELLQQLAKLTALEQQFAEAKRKLAAATGVWEQAVTLKTYAAGSAQELQLQSGVRQAQRQTELQQRRLDLAWKELERIVGKPPLELPNEYPELTLRLPAVSAAARNPEVLLASLAVDVEEARLKEQKGPKKPEFFLGTVLGSELDKYTEETTTRLAGTVEGQFDDFKFHAAVGGIVQTKTPYVSFGFSWSFPDKKIDALNVEERERLLDISRWNLGAARQLFLQSAELLALQAEELEVRRANFKEESSLAALQLAEGLNRHKAGLITDQQLSDLQWDVEKLRYSERLLRLDRLLVASQIEALTAAEMEAP